MIELHAGQCNGDVKQAISASHRSPLGSNTETYQLSDNLIRRVCAAYVRKSNLAP